MVTVFVVVIGGLAFIPAPHRFRAHGVVEAREFAIVAAATNGRLEAVVAPSGSNVIAGDVLLRFSNRELDLREQALHAEIRRLNTMRRLAISEESINLQSLDKDLKAAKEALTLVERDLASLELRAPFAGLWSAPRIDEMNRTWVNRGQAMGRIVGPQGYVFAAVVAQREAAGLFHDSPYDPEIRLAGQEGQVVPVSGTQVVASGQQYLPSAAVGWAAGGGVEIDPEDRSGRKAKETFYAVRAGIGETDISLRHGVTGLIRYDLEPEPLLRQWLRKLYHFLQQRYRL